MVNRGARWEDRNVLEGERLVGEQTPLQVSGDNRPRLVIIWLVVGAEKEATPLPCPRAEFAQEIRLEQAVLVMAFFWPRVGKEHVNVRKDHTGGEFAQKITGLAADEMQIREAGAIAFAE